MTWKTKEERNAYDRQRYASRSDVREKSHQNYLKLRNDPERYEEWKEYNRDFHRTRKYGLTPDELKAMFVNQDGRCAICKNKFKNRRHMSIDHIHSEGEQRYKIPKEAVRQLLCQRCNHIVGVIETTAQDILVEAISYIERHNGSVNPNENQNDKGEHAKSLFIVE